MLYFSERFSKYFFFTACVLLAGSIFVFHFYSHDLGMVCIGSGGVLTYTLGYPFFYKSVRGYYPSGYYSPIEEVEKLSMNDLAIMSNNQLAKYARIGAKITLNLSNHPATIRSFIENGIESYRDIMTGLAKHSLNVDIKNRTMSMWSFSLLATWQNELSSFISDQYTDSQTPKEYEMEIE